MALLREVISYRGRPFRACNLKRDLSRLEGQADMVRLARDARHEFINRLDELQINKIHTTWAIGWIEGIEKDGNLKSWISRRGVSAQTEWDAYVVERRRMANKPKPAPLPVKKIPVKPSDRLSISRRYTLQTWT